MEKIFVNEPESRLKKIFYNILDIAAFLVFIFGLFLFIKTFVIAPVIVKGHSMLPNYKPGEYIFIDRFYRKLTGGLKRGDVVVVMPSSSNVSFLKRIIGLPNEVIEIKSGYVFLCKTEEQWDKYTYNDYYANEKYIDNGLICKKLKEPYIENKFVNINGYPEKIITKPKCNIDKFVLLTGQYLVFGDDRMYSTDSRCCFRGFCLNTGDTYYVSANEILGRVWGIKFF